MTRTRIAFLVAALFASGCGSSSTTTDTTPTQTAAAPTSTENWSGTVPVGGSAFYSFNVSTYGTVNFNLLTVSGTNVPATITVGVGIGTPSGTTCSTTATTNVQANSTAGATPQLTSTYNPGLYCVLLSDVGNLAAPAKFTATVAHP